MTISIKSLCLNLHNITLIAIAFPGSRSVRTIKTAGVRRMESEREKKRSLFLLQASLIAQALFRSSSLTESLEQANIVREFK